MSGRGRRVLVLTAALLLAPLPLMPYVIGAREAAFAMGASGAALALASAYVARGEMRLKHRGLLGNKLLAASVGTLCLGVLMVVVSLIRMSKP
jgi:membrane associated rhomboid family serine protease